MTLTICCLFGVGNPDIDSFITERNINVVYTQEYGHQKDIFLSVCSIFIGCIEDEKGSPLEPYSNPDIWDRSLVVNAVDNSEHYGASNEYDCKQY
jgi:hypothetical protein